MTKVNLFVLNFLIALSTFGFAGISRSQDFETLARISGRSFVCPNGRSFSSLNMSDYFGNARMYGSIPITFWHSYYYKDDWVSQEQEKNINKMIKDERLKIYAYLTSEYDWQSRYPLKDPYYLKGIAEKFFSQDVKTAGRYESIKFAYVREEVRDNSGLYPSWKWGKRKMINSLLVNSQGEKLYFTDNRGTNPWLSAKGYYSNREYGPQSARRYESESYNLIPDNYWKTGRREVRYFCQKDHVLEKVVEIRSPNQWGYSDHRGNPAVTPMTILVKESIIDFD